MQLLNLFKNLLPPKQWFRQLKRKLNKQTGLVTLTPMFLRLIINQHARTPVISEFLDRSPEGAPMETIGQY